MHSTTERVHICRAPVWRLFASPICVSQMDKQGSSFFFPLVCLPLKNIKSVFLFVSALHQILLFCFSFCFLLLPCKSIRFSSMRVDTPVALVVNGKKLGIEKQAPAVVSLYAKSE